MTYRIKKISKVCSLAVSIYLVLWLFPEETKDVFGKFVLALAMVGTYALLINLLDLIELAVRGKKGSLKQSNHNETN